MKNVQTPNNPIAETKTDQGPETSTNSQVQFEFNCQQYLFNYVGLEGAYLTTIVEDAREFFSLDASIVLKICMSDNMIPLDQSAVFSSVLAQLGIGRHLKIYIDDFGSLTKAAKSNGTSSGKEKTKISEATQRIGRINLELDTNHTQPVYTCDDGYLLIPNSAVPMVQQHIKRPAALEVIFLSIGICLGTVANLLVAMEETAAQARLMGALIASLFFLVLLLIILMFTMLERKKVLQPITDMLKAIVRPKQKEHE